MNNEQWKHEKESESGTYMNWASEFKKYTTKIQHHILNERYATNNAGVWCGAICNTLHSYAYYLNNIKITFLFYMY